MTTTPRNPLTPRNSHTTTRFDTISALSDARVLEAALGPIDEVRSEPASTNGTTEAVHFRVAARLRSQETLRLWLKVNTLASDWSARGSGDDVGREPMMLAEPKLAGIWDAFTCPYRAFAIEGGVYGLLMDDLSSELYKGDVAFATADEDAVLRAMADLHARYWNSDALRLPWLQTAWRRMFFLGPHDQTAPERRERRVRYWPDPLPLLPRSVAELLTMPTDALAERCFGLPWTLFHGDLKGHNVAVLPQGRVAAVDWGLLGAGPPTLDLGWYLFVNWRKHARPKAEILARYRHFLKAARGEELSDAIWTRLVEVGLLCGAIMNTCHLLRDIVNRVPGATGEWDWRIAQLERLI